MQFFFHRDLYCLILKYNSNNKSSSVLVKRYRREFLTFLNISWEYTLLFSVETSCTPFIYIANILILLNHIPPSGK